MRARRSVIIDRYVKTLGTTLLTKDEIEHHKHFYIHFHDGRQKVPEIHDAPVVPRRRLLPFDGPSKRIVCERIAGEFHRRVRRRHRRAVHVVQSHHRPHCGHRRREVFALLSRDLQHKYVAVEAKTRNMHLRVFSNGPTSG